MENTRILMMRLSSAAAGVKQAAKSLNAVFQIVEESRGYAKPDGQGVCRYLVALVKRDE